MKKAITLISICLQISYAIAQQTKYIPFPSNMILYGYTSNGYSGTVTDRDQRMEVQGDTVFKGIHYSKYYNLTSIAGGIRNDIPNKKVYLYSLISQTEKLLYDFNMNVGDTVFKDNGYGFFPELLSSSGIVIDTAWVSRIDSILMPHDGLYHKRFNFMAKFKYHTQGEMLINSDILFKQGNLEVKLNPLIEGVGEFYNPISFLLDFEYYWELRFYCASIDNKVLIKDIAPNGPPHNLLLCNPLVAGVNEETNLENIKVYPNPSNGSFQLRVDNLKNAFFEISDVLGNKILISKIQNEITEIDLTSKSKGIYFIRVYNSSGLFTAKKLLFTNQ